MLKTWNIIDISFVICCNWPASTFAIHMKVLLHAEDVSTAAAVGIIFGRIQVSNIRGWVLVFFYYLLFSSTYAIFFEFAADLLINHHILECSIHLS